MATAFSENAESVNLCQRRYFPYVVDIKRCHPCQRCQRNITDPNIPIEVALNYDRIFV